MCNQAEEMILVLCLKDEIRNLFKFSQKLDFNLVVVKCVIFDIFRDLCAFSKFVSDLMFNFCYIAIIGIQNLFI